MLFCNFCSRLCGCESIRLLSGWLVAGGCVAVGVGVIVKVDHVADGITVPVLVSVSVVLIT